MGQSYLHRRAAAIRELKSLKAEAGVKQAERDEVLSTICPYEVLGVQNMMFLSPTSISFSHSSKHADILSEMFAPARGRSMSFYI